MADITDRELTKNRIKEAELAFGSVTAGYTTLIDLGATNLMDHFMLQNTLDKDVSLRFTAAGDAITVEANESFVLDNFAHGDGIIQAKHNGVAPSSGNIKIRSW